MWRLDFITVCDISLHFCFLVRLKSVQDELKFLLWTLCPLSHLISGSNLPHLTAVNHPPCVFKHAVIQECCRVIYIRIKTSCVLKGPRLSDTNTESSSLLSPGEGGDELQMHSNSSYIVVGKFQAEISLNSGYESLRRPPSKPCNCPTNELKASDHLQSAVGV